MPDQQHHESGDPPSAPTIGAPRPTGPDGLETYNRVAETVGLLPNLRLKDNLVQLVVVSAGIVIGAAVGLVLAGVNGHAGRALLGFAGLGAALGFIVFGVISGVVLMIVGWVRALTGWRNQNRK